MSANESTSNTLSLREVAEQLGVHYMTAYRYVRLGMLPATQSGRTWVVRVDDLEAFQNPPPDGVHRGDVDWAGRLIARMLEGDGAGAWSVTEAALSSGMSPRSAYVEMLVPALRRVGELWDAGEISVVDEHMASRVAKRIIAQLGPRMTRRGVPRGTVAIGTTATELHSIPVFIAADLMRDAGYRVLDLGAYLPPESFAEAITEYPDILAVAISVTAPGQESQIAETIRAIRRVRTVPIIVGGSGVSQEQALAAGSDSHAATVDDAIAYFESLRSSTKHT